MCNDANLMGRSFQDRTMQRLGNNDRAGTIDDTKQQVEESGDEEGQPDVVLLISSDMHAEKQQDEQEHEIGSTNSNACTVRPDSKQSKNGSHSPIPFVRLLPTHTMTSTCIHPPPYMTVKAAKSKKNTKATTSPSVRLLPAHTITSTCIHPPPALHMVPAARKKKNKTKAISPQQQDEDSGHEASTIKCDSSFGSISGAGDPERSLGDKGKDARRERNRLLARRRRERKIKWNNHMRDQIDHITDENEELRKKNKAVVKELISLGVDARTVMSRFTAQPPSNALECPNNQNINTSSMSTSVPLTQYPLDHHQLLSLLGMANSSSFQYAARPSPQLPSPLFFPAQQQALPSQSLQQEMTRSMVHPPPPQQHPWQQQATISLASTGRNLQGGATKSTAAEANSTTITSNGANHHHPHQYITAPNASSSLVGTAEFPGRDETIAENILSSYRQALAMVSQEIMCCAD